MGTKQQANLMVVVDTIDANGEKIGTRTVDMFDVSLDESVGKPRLNFPKNYTHTQP